MITKHTPKKVEAWFRKVTGLKRAKTDPQPTEINRFSVTHEGDEFHFAECYCRLCGTKITKDNFVTRVVSDIPTDELEQTQKITWSCPTCGYQDISLTTNERPESQRGVR